MAETSAGLLMYRQRDGAIEVFLVHPGGPFWARKDLGAWSIPKGLADPDEDPLEAARREFREETAMDATGPFAYLGSLRQPSGKIVHAWAFQGDCDPAGIRSNTFRMEWPPRSGRTREFPEVDRAGWFDLEEAGRRILKGQAAFLDRLKEALKGGGP
ncbi:MAG: NUDIX domain-containing protein [Thermodesulfovibrionales bacterium]